MTLHAKIEDGHRFLTEQNIWERTKFFVKIVLWWKTNNVRTKLIFQINEKNSHFKKTNEKNRSNELDLFVNVWKLSPSSQNFKMRGCAFWISKHTNFVVRWLIASNNKIKRKTWGGNFWNFFRWFLSIN